MAKVKIVLNSGQINKFLHSDSVKAMVKGKADEIQSRLGEGYKSDKRYMKSRVIASVYADTPEARRENLDRNTILKAVFGK